MHHHKRQSETDANYSTIFSWWDKIFKSKSFFERKRNNDHMNPLNHVAIIMDGNGRWGLKYKNSRNAGHKAGLNTVEKIIKESIKNNGGSVTKESFEIYKADLGILSKYAAADTDLTLRICNLYLGKLRDEGLDKFFFEDEVMPIYREVTIPMEACGVDLDMELIEKTHKEISEDLNKNKEVVKK